MALSFADIAAVSSTTSGATLNVTITAAIGDHVFLFCAADNNGTSGASSTSASITDAAGNSWSRISEVNNDPGSAAAGTTLSIWQSKITATLTAATVTINFSPDTTSKTALGYVVTPAAGAPLVVYTIGAGFTGASGTTFTTGNFSVVNGQTILAVTALEGTTAATADADTTDGNWSTAITGAASTGTNNTSASITAQRKTVTASGTQSYETTQAGGRDWAVNYLLIAESTGVVAATLDAVTSSAAGTLAIAGTASVTLGAVTSSATGTLPIVGALAGTLGAATLSATGALAIAGALTATLGAVTGSATSTIVSPPQVVASIRILVEVTWPDETVTRLWDGSGPVIDNDGEVWRGATISNGLDGVEQALNGSAYTLNMTLSGVAGDTSATAFMAYTEDNIVGAGVRLMIQPCDEHDMPIDGPEVKFVGQIDNVIFDDVASATGITTNITAEVTNRFTLRRVISGRVLSDIDQKARSAVLNPGADPDLFCTEVSKMQDRTIVWPRFN